MLLGAPGIATSFLLQSRQLRLLPSIPCLKAMAVSGGAAGLGAATKVKCALVPPKPKDERPPGFRQYGAGITFTCRVVQALG